MHCNSYTFCRSSSTEGVKLVGDNSKILFRCSTAVVPAVCVLSRLVLKCPVPRSAIFVSCPFVNTHTLPIAARQEQLSQTSSSSEPYSTRPPPPARRSRATVRPEPSVHYPGSFYSSDPPPLDFLTRCPTAVHTGRTNTNPLNMDPAHLATILTYLFHSIFAASAFAIATCTARAKYKKSWISSALIAASSVFTVKICKGLSLATELAVKLTLAIILTGSTLIGAAGLSVTLTKPAVDANGEILFTKSIGLALTTFKEPVPSYQYPKQPPTIHGEPARSPRSIAYPPMNFRTTGTTTKPGKTTKNLLEKKFVMLSSVEQNSPKATTNHSRLADKSKEVVLEETSLPYPTILNNSEATTNHSKLADKNKEVVLEETSMPNPTTPNSSEATNNHSKLADKSKKVVLEGPYLPFPTNSTSHEAATDHSKLADKDNKVVFEEPHLPSPNSSNATTDHSELSNKDRKAVLEKANITRTTKTKNSLDSNNYTIIVDEDTFNGAMANLSTDTSSPCLPPLCTDVEDPPVLLTTNGTRLIISHIMDAIFGSEMKPSNNTYDNIFTADMGETTKSVDKEIPSKILLDTKAVAQNNMYTAIMLVIMAVFGLATFLAGTLCAFSISVACINARKRARNNTIPMELQQQAIN